MLFAMTSADINKRVAYGRVVVKEMHGWNAQNVDLYIQFHQLVVVAGGGTVVPVCKSFLAQANNGFMYSFTPGIELSCLTVVISTTEPNYTAPATGIDLTLDIDTQFSCDGTETVVQGTGVTNQQVWAEASGPPTSAKKRLLRLDVVTHTADQLFGLVYAVDTPVAGSLITTFVECPGNKTTVFLFGDDQSGYPPYQQDANYTSHGGCTIQFSDTYVAAHQYGSTAPDLIALYK